MKEFHTSVVELRQPIMTPFSSEPYECGWASEATFFVTLHEEQHPSTEILVRPKISPDGIHWTDAAVAPIAMTQSGLYALSLTNFGGWLKLDFTTTNTAQAALITVHLALKG